MQEEYEDMIESATMKVWGKEITIDMLADEPLRVNDPVNLKNFVDELVRRIDMKSYGKTQIELFGEGELYGYTVVQLIYTSNITLHTTQKGEAYLNLFSCKTFDENVVKDCVLEFFGGKIDYSEVVYRGVKYN